MNTRLWRGVRRSHTPWCLFGSFLDKQKGTSVSSAAKRRPKTKGTAHGPSLWFYSTVFKDSTISSFFSFQWAAKFTTRENTVVSSTAHR